MKLIQSLEIEFWNVYKSIVLLFVLLNEYLHDYFLWIWKGTEDNI